MPKVSAIDDSDQGGKHGEEKDVCGSAGVRSVRHETRVLVLFKRFHIVAPP